MPREVICLIVDVVDPQLDKIVYDSYCGTGVFLIEAYDHLIVQNPTPTQITALKSETFFGHKGFSVRWMVFNAINQPDTPVFERLCFFYFQV